MKNVNLSTPWHIYRNKLAALFELDDDVTVSPVSSKGEAMEVAVSVKNHAKAEALGQLLKPSVTFGNITLDVIVSDDSGEMTPDQIVRSAFAYNGLVNRIETFTDAAGAEHLYVVFDPDVIQFFADDLSDYRGNYNGLAEDVARELFDADVSVNFCTADLREN